MTRLIGAALVILTGAWIGISAADELGKRVSLSRELRCCVERMRTEICLRRLPLPETLTVLKTEFPSLFSVTKQEEDITQYSFSEMWNSYVRRMGLPEAEEGTVRRLGETLSAGEDPERVFSAALKELEEEHHNLCARRKERSRLYVALGFAAGCMAVILML